MKQQINKQMILQQNSIELIKYWFDHLFHRMVKQTAFFPTSFQISKGRFIPYFMDYSKSVPKKCFQEQKKNLEQMSCWLISNVKCHLFYFNITQAKSIFHTEYAFNIASVKKNA